jgi:pSer/pThr/pTyr-binding forkhead associated (FHA) protein
LDTPLRLHVTPAEGAPFDHPLRTDSLVVGRAMDADLTLSDPFLSRRHSRFYRTGAVGQLTKLSAQIPNLEEIFRRRKTFEGCEPFEL